MGIVPRMHGTHYFFLVSPGIHVHVRYGSVYIAIDHKTAAAACIAMMAHLQQPMDHFVLFDVLLDFLWIS